MIVDMKKILLGMLCAVFMCSCMSEQNEIVGTWKSTFDGYNGYGESVTYWTFKSNGKYVTHYDYESNVKGDHEQIETRGKYLYDGERLYMYRDMCRDTIVMRVQITGRTMYVYKNECITKFNR